jgi:hypothetical protein
MAVLMVSVRVGDRALPVAWLAEAGPTNIGFEGRGFELGDSQLEHADRLERLVLIMSLAMFWCDRAGQEDASNRPTPFEKNAVASRSRALELQEAPPQPGFLVHPGPALSEAVPAKRPAFACLL